MAAQVQLGGNVLKEAMHVSFEDQGAFIAIAVTLVPAFAAVGGALRAGIANSSLRASARTWGTHRHTHLGRETLLIATEGDSLPDNVTWTVRIAVRVSVSVGASFPDRTPTTTAEWQSLIYTVSHTGK